MAFLPPLFIPAVFEFLVCCSLLLWPLQSGRHVFILIRSCRRSWLKRISWIAATSIPAAAIDRPRHIVNLNKLAAIVTALSGPGATSAAILGQHRHPVLLLPYLGCVRLALRIRRPCCAAELLDGCDTGLREGQRKERNGLITYSQSNEKRIENYRSAVQSQRMQKNPRKL